MCNNIIVLSFFIFLKVFTVLLFPIIIFILRKKDYSKILILINIVLLIFFITCNIFNINSCVYNSNINGIKRVNNKNSINLYNKMHPTIDNSVSYDITPEKKFKTYTGRDLYYFNQNKDYMKDAYYICNGKKYYINTFGSSITSFSIAISTLYDKTISPLEVFNNYKEDYIDICSGNISIEKVYNSVMKRYGALTLTQINKSQIISSLQNDGLIIVELEGNENSKLTCDYNNIVIYGIDLSGKYMIADPALPNSSFVCPYSSEAYGNVIDSNNMNKSFTLDEIDNEAVRYYLVKKV